MLDAHRAMQFLHFSRSTTNWVDSSHVTCMISKSLFIASLHFFPGLPFFFFPAVGIQCMAWCDMVCSSIRCRCPSHLNRLCLILSSNLNWPERLQTSSFLTISFQEIPSISLCHLWRAASSLCIFAVIGRVSDSYSRVERIKDLYNLNLLITLRPFSLQM